MIANAHGHELDLPALRRRFPVSLRGVTLATMIDQAHELGFDTRPLRIELEYLPELQTPCILHWNLNHFVVLKQAKGNLAEIHDPTCGMRMLPMSEVSRCFTGVALELLPSAHFHPIKEAQSITLRKIAGRLHGLAPALLQVALLAFSLELFTLIVPFYAQLVLDQVLITGDRSLLSVLGVAFLFVIGFQALMAAMRGWAISWLGGKLATQWISNLFHHLLRLPLSYFEKRHVGDIASRFNSVQVIRSVLSGNFIETLLNGVLAPVTLITLAVYSPRLTLVVLLSCVIYAILRWLSWGRLWRASEEQLTYSAQQTTSLFESIRGAQAIKLANKEGLRSARFASLVLNTTQREVTTQRIASTFAALNQGLFGVQRVAVVWLGAASVLDGRFSVGMLVAFLAYSDQLTTCISGLIDRLVEFRMLRLHAARIADIALTAPEANAGQCDSQAISSTPELEVDNVSFRYAENEPWVLRHCNLKIPAGTSVAIAGPSGCGKTTLAKLIVGLLVPTEGAVRINGIDIRQFGLKAYRNLVGTVMQDDQLFEGSIADNISFFDQDATPECTGIAARLAAIHDDIKAMTMGYNTLVGDMGSSLSGGQKQRILLARALYRQPRVLLLDEATSHLDTHRESEINQAVAKLNVTRILIAHRLDTIASADTVFQLD